MLETCVRGPVPYRVMQPGRAFERQPRLSQRDQAVRQRLVVRECLRRGAAGPHLGQVPVVVDRTSRGSGEVTGRDLDEGGGAGQRGPVERGSHVRDRGGDVFPGGRRQFDCA